jgi:hypothetical protein
MEKLGITGEELEAEGYFKFKTLRKDVDDSMRGILPKGGYAGLEEECEKAAQAALRCRSQEPATQTVPSSLKAQAQMSSASSLSDGPTSKDAEAARPYTPLSANWADDLGTEAALQLAEKFMIPSGPNEKESTEDVLAALIPTPRQKPQRQTSKAQQDPGIRVSKPVAADAKADRESKKSALEKQGRKRTLTEDWSSIDGESRPATADTVNLQNPEAAPEFSLPILFPLLPKRVEITASEALPSSEPQKPKQAQWSLPTPPIGPSSSRCMSASDLLKKGSEGFAPRTWPSCRSTSVSASTVRNSRLNRQVRGFERSVSFGALTAPGGWMRRR